MKGRFARACAPIALGDGFLHDNGMRMAIPVAGKRIKAFKKRHDGEPELGGMDNDDEQPKAEDELADEE